MNPVILYCFVLFLFIESSHQQSRRRRGNNPPVTRNIPITLDNCPLGVENIKKAESVLVQLLAVQQQQQQESLDVEIDENDQIIIK